MLRITVCICQSLIPSLTPKHAWQVKELAPKPSVPSARNAQLARPNTDMRTALSTQMMHCTLLGPSASQLHPYRARYTPSVCLLGAKTCKLSQRRQSQCKRAKLSHVQTHASADVFALDFDGVLVDSEPEISSSAIAAASEYWPEKFGKLDDAANHQVRHNLRQVRPVLVNGVEALVMARMVLEDPSCTDSIIKDWQNVLPAILKEWQIEQKDLQSFFEDFRNNLLQNHEDEWVKRHVMYPGLQETLKSCKYPWYVVTSRAKHRTLKLIDALLDMQWPEDTPRLYSKMLPPNEKKIETLQQILNKPMVKEQNATVHFVDDRYETVKAIAAEPSLGKVRVYMADWGYSTQAEKDAARDTKGVRLISLDEFQELLNWGILMGVDDGCGDDN